MTDRGRKSAIPSETVLSTCWRNTKHFSWIMAWISSFAEIWLFPSSFKFLFFLLSLHSSQSLKTSHIIRSRDKSNYSFPKFASSKFGQCTQTPPSSYKFCELCKLFPFYWYGKFNHLQQFLLQNVKVFYSEVTLTQWFWHMQHVGLTLNNINQS